MNFWFLLLLSWVSLVAQLVKNLTAMQGTWVRSLGWEDPLERERLSTPVYWPGEFHRLYSPWGHKSWTWLSDFRYFLPSSWNTNKIVRAAAAVLDCETTLKKEATCQGRRSRKEEVANEFVYVRGAPLDFLS